MSADPGQRQFQCGSCNGMITIPVNLPPTTAPCPMCGSSTTSPAPETPVQGQPVQQQPAPARRPDVMNAAPLEVLRPIGERKKGGAGLLWAVAGLSLVGLVVGGFFLMSKLSVDPAQAPDSGHADVPDSGLDRVVQAPVENLSPDVDAAIINEARLVIDGFFRAKTPEEMAQFIIGGADRVEELRAFYAVNKHMDSKLDAKSFTVFPMSEEEIKRGIFLLDYHRPEQFELASFFRPIAPLEIQMKVEKPSLNVRTKALVDNFKMEAQRVRAFFKKIDGSYKLDWDSLVQTQFRLFRDFISYPSPGQSSVFRVFLSEDITPTLEKDHELRAYRIADAAHVQDDQITVEVVEKSRVGQLLSPLNWTDLPGKSAKGKTATVRMSWTTDPEPKLVIDEVICWEFLHVGGDPSNLKLTE